MIAGIRSGWLVAVVGGFSLSLAGAAGSASSGPLVIGVEGPQSGAQAANGLDQLRGVRLAVRQLNARGGLWDGRKVAIFAAATKAMRPRRDQLRVGL
jgi:ABC-type branched-subunit amino acid transport system substrate-binding protein